MQIGIIGATGKAGSLILKEAQARGHEVTAIVRNASKISDSSVNILEKNVLDLTNADLQGFDVVVNAFAAAPGQETQYVEVGRVLIEALKGTNTRLFVIGGLVACSLMKPKPCDSWKLQIFLRNTIRRHFMPVRT